MNWLRSFWWLVGLVVIIIVVVLVAQRGRQITPPTTPTETQGVVEVKFANHPQLGLPEQDVFVESRTNKNQVVRLEAKEATASANLAKTIFTAGTAVDHDPFKIGKNPLGPYSKGKSLGFTLKQWLGATGAGTYTVTGDNAELNLTFTNLVPNGTYTVWCSRITLPPNVNIVDKPCGAPDGSENAFTADAAGNTIFNLKLKPLEESTKETVTAIALAYHSDGKTYGAAPGDFGLNSHVQIAFLIPPPSVATPK